MFEDILTDEVLRRHIIEAQGAVGLAIRIKNNLVESIDGEHDEQWERMFEAAMIVVLGYLDYIIVKLNERKSLEEFKQRRKEE